METLEIFHSQMEKEMGLSQDKTYLYTCLDFQNITYSM